MKRYFKKYFFALSLVFACALFIFLGAYENARAEEISPLQLIDLFVSLGIIPADKAELARQTLNSQGGSGFSFTKDLKTSDDNTDVRELQKTLNLEAKTRVSDTGLGSLGNETTYFGPKTKAAVIAFQELYRNEVLIPANLYAGTGFVGSFTRKKLNEIRQKGIFSSSVPAPSPPPASSVPPPSPPTGLFVDSPNLILSYPSKNEAISGDIVNLTGTGFTKTGNTVNIGAYAIKDLPSPTGSTITFALPSSIPAGKYDLSVSNSKGITNDSGVYLLVKEKGAIQPKILSVNPASGTLSTTITVTGEGFTPTGNDIYTNYAIIKNVSSPDGKTLQFKPPAEAGESGTDPLTEAVGVSVPVWFYILNAGGISETTATFTLNL